MYDDLKKEMLEANVIKLMTLDGKVQLGTY